MGALASFGTGLVNAMVGGFVDTAAGSFDRSADMKTWKEQMKIQDQYQREMVKFQNQENAKYNQEMTNFNAAVARNEYQHYYDNYNSPTAMMEAYTKAGINPNLVAGKISGTGMPTLSTSSGGSSAGTPGASMPSYQFGRSLLHAQHKELRLKHEYQQQEIEMRDLDIESKRIDIQSKINGLMSEPFEVDNEEYDPDPNLPTLHPRNMKKREATDIERLHRGLSERNVVNSMERKAKFKEHSASMAESALREMQANFDRSQIEELKRSGVYPLIVAAAKESEELTKLVNSNSISLKGIGKSIDDMDIPEWSKWVLKGLVSNIFINNKD